MSFVALTALVALAVPVSPGAAETLRVLTTELPPFFFHEEGEPVGIELEILQFHAKANGLALEIRFVDHWKELFPALERGEGDVVAAAVTVTDERRKRFDFAAPHFPIQMHLVERRGEQVRSVSELAGRKVGVLAGSTGREAFQGVPNLSVVPLPSVEALFTAVSDGTVRAIASESADAFLFIEKLGNIEMGIPLGEQQNYGFALPLGSPHQEALSQSVVRLRQSGIYFRILEKYLGARAVELFKAGQK